MAQFPASLGISRPTPTTCVTQVELFVSCRCLIDRDATSKSDPTVVLYLNVGGRFTEVGRTEIIKNNHNPDFCRSIKIDYFFEEVQKLKFVVYDIDNDTKTLADDDFLSVLECTLGEIVSSSPCTRQLLSKSGHKQKSKIIIRAQEIGKGGNDLLLLAFHAKKLDNKEFFSKSDPFLEFRKQESDGNWTVVHRTEIRAQEIGKGGNDLLLLAFHAKKLDNKEFFSKSDPFLEFRKQESDGNWTVVHRTEVIKNNLNPIWRPFTIKMQNLGGNNPETGILIYCYDYESDGEHAIIGQCSTSLAQILEAQHHQLEWPCINKKKQRDKGSSYKNSGIIYLSSCKVIKNYTFLDYIFGGTQINFTVAIDFTGSNGNPAEPNSLHYISNNPNDYMKAIWAVGNVIQDYDSDKMFPALGFGARIPPSWEVSHEFAINFNNSNPFCTDNNLVNRLEWPCINKKKQRDKGSSYKNSGIIYLSSCKVIKNYTFLDYIFGGTQINFTHYFILLILTDGVVSDMNETRKAIVQASRLPMSIIIVGVGRADFSAMDFLDGDNGRLYAPDGSYAERDVVQFVPFYKYEMSPLLLAKEVLAELPQQVVQYFMSKNIPPNVPRHTPN
ncbi:copine-3-like [Centruroides sculpturatus]|uniref:copine-3-like n=1 Tax=Centruroides sculpturatus TaxID=218467 RepID=UPI000C6CCCDA|nr:copine-3-like [Centruroides sculpturatus]